MSDIENLDFDSPTNLRTKIEFVVTTIIVCFVIGLPCFYFYQWLSGPTGFFYSSSDPLNLLIQNRIFPWVLSIAMFFWMEFREVNRPEFWFNEKEEPK